MAWFRLSDNEVRSLFYRYGYELPQDFKHKNVHTKYKAYDLINERMDELSVVQLRYRIDRAPITRPEYLPFPFNDMAVGEPIHHRTSFQRWMDKHWVYADIDRRKIAYNTYVQTMRDIGKKKTFNVAFANTDKVDTLYGFLEALKEMDYSGYDVRLTITSNTGNESYVHANANTISYLNDIFESRKDFTDSDAYAINELDDIANIRVEFIPLQHNNRAPGYFPYTHDTDLDLRKFGIYSTEEELLSIGNESCLVTALRSVLNSDEVDLLKAMIKTRYVLKTDLKHIATTFNLKINVKTVTDYAKGKTSHADYEPINGCDEHTRTAKLMIAYDHYFINETVTYNERKLSILSIIKRLESEGHLKPLSRKCIKQLVLQFRINDEHNINSSRNSRPVYIKPKKLSSYYRKRNIKQTNRFFGYDCPLELANGVGCSKSVDERISELQTVIDQLPLRHHIDVSSYFKFSDLAQAIAYEYGVYDNVYELTGAKAAAIRDSLEFPQTKIINGKAFYYNAKEHNNKPLYYLDMNAAYMGFAQSIPTGPDANGAPNNKLGELMEQLYTIRRTVKSKQPELAITLKFIMNSFYGYSIRRAAVIKTKYRQNPTAYEQRFGKFIIKTQGNYISTIKSYCEHYTCPHLAASILGSFNSFLKHIMSLVNVYYINVDAILTDEDGYKKLLELGFIGDNLRQFKIEKIFDEIAIISSRRYVAKCNGEEQNHLCKNLSFNDVVNIAKSTIKLNQK